MSLSKEVEKSLKCLERFSKDYGNFKVQKMCQKLLGRKRKIPSTSIQPLAKRPKKPDPKYVQLKKRLYDGEFLSMNEVSHFTNFEQEQEETIEKMLINQEFVSMQDLHDFLPPIKYGMPSTSKTPIEKMREKFENGQYLTMEELASFLDFNQIGGGLQENKNLDKAMKDIESGNGNAKGYFEGFKISHFLKLSEAKKAESFQKKYLTFETACVIRNVHDAKRPDLLLDKLFDIVLKKALEGRSEPHLLNLQLYGQGMDTPYYVPLRSPEQNNAAAFAALFHELTQSEKLREIFNTRLLVKVCAVWLPEGGNSYDKGLTVPCSTGNKWCLARAIIFGINYLELPRNKFDHFVQNQLEVATFNLMKLAGISEKKQYYSLEDAVKLQRHISYRLIIFDEYKTMIYKGVKEGKDLCLILKNRHYDFIKNPFAFLKCHKFCFECARPVTRIFHGKECRNCCRSCMRFGQGFPCTGNASLYCQDCGFYFKNQECMDYHYATKTGQRQHKSLCQERYYCINCNKVIQRRGNPKKHQCEQIFTTREEMCKRCHEMHAEGNEHCFIQPILHTGNPLVRYVYFDIETYVKKGEHIPNFLCAIVLCSACADENINPYSQNYAPNCVCYTKERVRIFEGFKKGDDPVLNFLKFLLVRSTKIKMAPTVILSHYGGMFDMHLLVNPLLQHGIRPKLTCAGFKIYRMEVMKDGNKFIFKDSFNFFMTGLANLPKMFDLTVQKGYFPHKFNKPKNLFLHLKRLPKLKYYDPDNMKPLERAKFMEWYKLNKNQPFNLKDELIKYGTQDVVVLMQSCVKYRQIMLDATNIDAFYFAGTTAKFAMEVYRRNFLKPNLMVNAPEKGYRNSPKIQASDKSLKFLKIYAKVKKLRIREATWKDGEYQVPGTNYYVDGVILDKNDKPIKAIEFLGCYYHGCNKCYPKQDMRLANGESSINLYTTTMNRIEEIRKIMPIQYVWECQATKWIKSSKYLKKLYKNIVIAKRMEIRRDALRGGRTENFRFEYTCKKDEEIVSIDMISLYPYVMKYCSYPIGNPEVLTEESIKNLPWTKPKNNPYKGFILCQVLPPQHLRLPVLPYKTEEGRIVFPLCASCAEKKMVKKCRHSTRKRAWISAFTHVELNCALKKKYKVLKVFEVWHYKKWSKDLFKQYINTFLKYKIENSGWGNVENREQFIAEYMEKEGIELDPENITVNPGKKACAKYLLNSLWGKMAQRAELSQVTFTNTPKSFWSTILDDTIEVLDITKINQNIDRIVTRKKQEFQDQPLTNNLPVAAFVTSHARLKLYYYLSKVKPGRLLYCDTDSMYYIRKLKELLIKEGLYLGDMERDLIKRRIFDFYAAGPKNYGYKHVARDDPEDIQAEMKVRGFALTYNATQSLTYDAMKAATIAEMKGETTSTIDIKYHMIKRNKQNKLLDQSMVKSWRPVFNKGRVNKKTLVIRPYGYISKKRSH